MLTFGADQTAAALPFEALVIALRSGFARGAHTPDREHYTIDPANESTLLLMPAWNDRFIGVKLVNVFPTNAALPRPAVSSVFVLAAARTGEHVAIIDGDELTRRRTVATSALAASYLARPDSSALLVAGAGRVGSLAFDAYRTLFPIQSVFVYDPNPHNAHALVAKLRGEAVNAEVVEHLEDAVSRADIITCATLAVEPLIHGRWLSAGTHLDLIGSFRPHMREADDECFTRGRVFVDTLTALKESGDLVQPINDGVLRAAEVVGTLEQLCRETVGGRRADDEITVFKAVGSALADLIGAAVVVEGGTGGVG
jgi:ornithine cyclodeaminase/alanine dehydrogenase-like protein (mu-crystallin family)